MKKVDQLKAQRLTEVFDELCKNNIVANKAHFAASTQINQSQMTDMLNGKKVITEATLKKIENRFPFVSISYIQHGVGEIFKTAAPVVLNINGENAQGTQILGDNKTTNVQSGANIPNHTKTLLDSHVSLMQQMQELTKVIASQQETISQLMAINSNK